MVWRNIEIDQLMAEEALIRRAMTEDLLGPRTQGAQPLETAKPLPKRLFAAARRVVAWIRHT